MDAFSGNKFIVLAVALVAIVGALALGFAPVSEPHELAQGTEETARPNDASSASVPDEARSVQEASEENEDAENVHSGVGEGPAIALPVPKSALMILKDVGEAAYDHFALTDSDFRAIKDAGFDAIEGNFDICAEDANVQFFLDGAHTAGLKVILNAGAGEAEWGYPCDEEPDSNMKPTWQANKVRAWIQKWKAHPALYAWDTSNEDGGTFPFGTGGTDPDPEWETKYSLSAAQLREAYADVKSWDPAHPVMIRMNGWYFYDNDSNFFRSGNAFGKDVADIVMVNAYSNVDEYFSDFVTTVMLRATRSIHAIDADVQMVPALGVWREPPIWVKPTPAQLVNDFNQAVKTEDLLGIGFFKYGAAGSEWLLPDTRLGAPELWQKISELVQ